MSASEKLKGLGPVEVTIAPWPEGGSVTLYAIPLPQIVAVVEAAEEAKSAFGYVAQTQRLHPEQSLEKYGRVNEKLLHAALSALEEALGPPPPRDSGIYTR